MLRCAVLVQLVPCGRRVCHLMNDSERHEEGGSLGFEIGKAWILLSPANYKVCTVGRVGLGAFPAHIETNS